MIKKIHSPKRSEASKNTTAKTASTTVNAAAFEQFLKGSHFPTNKNELVRHLQHNKATKEVLNIADQFTEREYVSIADVAKEFSRVKKQ